MGKIIIWTEKKRTFNGIKMSSGAYYYLSASRAICCDNSREILSAMDFNANVGFSISGANRIWKQWIPFLRSYWLF